LFEKFRLSFDLTGAVGLPRLSCPTRWTAQTKFFETVLHNYKAFLETLLLVAVGNDGVTCLEVTPKPSGIYAKLETFDLIFATAVCTKFYSLIDQLSTALLCRHTTATEGENSAEVTRSAVHFPHFGRKPCSKRRGYRQGIPVFREHVDLIKNCNLAQGQVHSVQFPERLLSYDILRRCRQHQWRNTKDIQPGNFLSLCKMPEIADISCKQSVRDRRELGSREKAFVTIWLPQGCLMSWLF